MDTKTRKPSNLVPLLSNMAANATGAAVATATSHPGAALVATMCVPLVASLYHAGMNLLSRPISHREEDRAHRTYLAVMNRYWERIGQGERIRDDGFFDDSVDRSPSEELFEATLETCMRQYEERKLPFIAHIYANALFETISPSTVHSVLRLAQERSFRQLCLIALLADERTESLVNAFYQAPDSATPRQDEAPFVRHELEQLVGRATGILAVESDRLALTRSGRLSHRLMGLGEIGQDDLDSVLMVIGRDNQVVA